MEIKEELKNSVIEMCSLMSVSGFEGRSEKELMGLVGDGFDESYRNRAGSYVFVKRCGKENAPRVIVDAHYDEIGMVVTEICDGGFLKFTNVGGIDRAILGASDVLIYGEEVISGVVASTPPHLRGGSDGKFPEMTDMLIDTGMDKEYLERTAPVGTPIGFRPKYSEFGNCIAGKSLDDKACAAIAAYAVSRVQRQELAADVYLVLSSYEETSHLGGISPAAYEIDPHYAMVIDVNLAACPDTPKNETVEFRKGISLSLSAATDIELTRATEKLCEEKNIAHTLIVSSSSTGTNATSLNIVRGGVPTVDVGLPLKYMHTYNEVMCLEDAMSLCGLVEEFVKSKEIADRFNKDSALFFGEEA